MEKRGCMGVSGQTAAALYVSVYVPEFSAQALLRLRPDAARSPVVVLAGDPPFEQVCSANAQSFKLGITQGMTRAELDSFTDLCVLRRSDLEERAAHAALADAAGVFTPRVEVQPLMGAAFVMVLDMTGTTRISGPIERALSNIARTMTSLRFSVQCAASANLSTAVCLAPVARKTPVIVPAGMEAAFLRDLPLSALRLTAEQAEALALWGLRTVGELAMLPEVELVVRLGSQGKRLRLLARGEHPHLMVPEEPAFALKEYIAFDSPVELLDSLLFVLGPMLDQLLSRAQNRAYALASVTVKLGLDGGGEHERTIKPALPVAQREVLLRLLQLDFHAHPPTAGVVSVSVQAEPGHRSTVQAGLFAPPLPEPMRLDVTLARVAALVGEERVGRARLLDTHRPDSFVMERFVIPTDVPRTPKNTQHTIAVRRCRPPMPVAMRIEGQRPTSFRLRGKLHIVKEAYGPWRKSGEWWSSEVWSREEWDVCAKAGEDSTLLCVLTHDLLHHHWQIEALYD